MISIWRGSVKMLSAGQPLALAPDVAKAAANGMAASTARRKLDLVIGYLLFQGGAGRAGDRRMIAANGRRLKCRLGIEAIVGGNGRRKFGKGRKRVFAHVRAPSCADGEGLAMKALAGGSNCEISSHPNCVIV
jgi:hypothetical protein